MRSRSNNTVSLALARPATVDLAAAILLALALLFALCLPAQASPSSASGSSSGSSSSITSDPEPLVVPQASTAPVIDGRLDEAIWTSAMKFDSFKTFKPDFGQEMSQKTESFLTYDPDNIYFAFRCYDTEPSKIKTSVCRRDAMGQDDMVGVIIDTFNDNQSGFTFMLNPSGIQGDGILNNQGNVDDSFDTVWDSKGVVDDKGWTVEARVPLTSIRFPNRKTLTMKVIFFRFLTRTSEQSSFPPFAPDKGTPQVQALPVQVSGLKYHRVVEILPAFTYGNRYGAESGSYVRQEENKDPSLTAKIGLTSDLILDGAVNPDFSQVEADAGQVDINLRYDLYYQEKRPFFLEGQDLWMFGGAMEDAPLIALVYTRTIVDPVYGFRLTGKITPKDTLAAIYAKDNLPGDPVDVHPDFTIARYKHTLKSDSYIGGFYTGREAGRVFNRVGGFDGRFRLSDTSVFSLHLLGSLTRPDGADKTNKDHALSLYYSFQNRRWALELGYQDISRNFQVDTGFLERTGVRRLGGFAMYQIYPKSKFFQKIDPFYWCQHIYDTFDNMWETWNFFVLRFSLPRNTMVRFEGILANEVFAGRRFDRSGVGFRAETQILKELFVYTMVRRWGVIYYDRSDPYQGNGNRIQAELRYQPTAKLNLGLELAYQDFYRRSDGEKIYDYTILRNRNTFQINKYLFLRGIVEYNFYRKRMTYDALVSFTYIPGTVFYVGYGSALERLEWDGMDYRPADRFMRTRSGFFFKVSYLWRL